LEWRSTVWEISVKSVASAVEPEIVRRVESLLTPADKIEARLSAAQRQVDALMRPPKSHRHIF